jgi:RNA polymerase sigma-70 factor, ECF subfamily
MDDSELVARMAAGDHAAISILYDRYSGALMGLAMRIVKQRQDAEDLLHDVFLEAWRTAATFDPQRGRVWTWLAVRMRSRAIDKTRSAWVTRAESGDIERVRAPRQLSPAELVRVRGALANLSSIHRRALELMYFEGLTCREIAERDAIPLPTVKSRLARALLYLREQLRPRVAA